MIVPTRPKLQGWRCTEAGLKGKVSFKEAVMAAPFRSSGACKAQRVAASRIQHTHLPRIGPLHGTRQPAATGGKPTAGQGAVSRSLHGLLSWCRDYAETLPFHTRPPLSQPAQHMTGCRLEPLRSPPAHAVSSETEPGFTALRSEPRGVGCNDRASIRMPWLCKCSQERSHSCPPSRRCCRCSAGRTRHPNLAANGNQSSRCSGRFHA